MIKIKKMNILRVKKTTIKQNYNLTLIIIKLYILFFIEKRISYWKSNLGCELMRAEGGSGKRASGENQIEIWKSERGPHIHVDIIIIIIMCRRVCACGVAAKVIVVFCKWDWEYWLWGSQLKTALTVIHNSLSPYAPTVTYCTFFFSLSTFWIISNFRARSKYHFDLCIWTYFVLVYVLSNV